MNLPEPKIRIEIIERSEKCFWLGLFSLIPVLGLPLAVMSLGHNHRIRRLGAGQWNPVGIRTAGIRMIRNPFEPAWASHATGRASLMRVAEIAVLRRLRPACLRIIADAGFRTTDGTIAMAATGVLDSATLSALLGRLAPGTWELVTHPGYNDADRVRTRLRASRDGEREALATLRQFPLVELISFRDLDEQRSN